MAVKNIGKPIDLKKATVEELKAFAYDCLASIEANQQSLQQANLEIKSRLEVEKVDDKKHITNG